MRRINWAIAAIAALAALALPATAAAGTVRYASPTGSGSACTEAAPCSIETAVEGVAVADGDTVVLLPGTYVLGGRLDVADAITVRGVPGAAIPRLENPVSQTSVQVENSGAVLEGLQVVNSNSSPFGGSALFLLAGSVNRVSAIATGEGFTGCQVMVQTVLRNSACISTGASGEAINLNVSLPGAETYIATLENVSALAYGEFSRGIGLQGVGSDPGGSVTLQATNTIARGAEVDVEVKGEAGTGVSADAVFSHSNYAVTQVGENATVTAPGSNGNQTAPPLLADGPSGDVHELAGSPTIDAGILDSLVEPLDLYGSARDQGAAPDIGAAEFTPPPVQGGSGGTATVQAQPAQPVAPTPPGTVLRKAKINHDARGAKFAFAGVGGSGSIAFECKLDRGKFRPCRSPKLYRHLKAGKHAFRVRAVDAGSGKADPTPVKRKFRI